MKKIKKQPSPAKETGLTVQLTFSRIQVVIIREYLKIFLFSNAGVVESGLRRWTYDPVDILANVTRVRMSM